MQKSLISGQNLLLLQVQSSISKDSKVTLSVTNNIIKTATSHLLLSLALPCSFTPMLSTPSQQKASRLLKFQMFGFAPHIWIPIAAATQGLFGKWQSWVLISLLTIQEFCLWESFMPSQAPGWR